MTDEKKRCGCGAVADIHTQSSSTALTEDGRILMLGRESETNEFDACVACILRAAPSLMKLNDEQEEKLRARNRLTVIDGEKA